MYYTRFRGDGFSQYWFVYKKRKFLWDKKVGAFYVYSDKYVNDVFSYQVMPYIEMLENETNNKN